MIKRFAMGLLLGLFVQAVAARDLYVRAGGTSTPPYTSPETAATSPALAVGVCLDGDTIHIGDGDWVSASALLITNAVTLVSDNGPEALLLKWGAGITVNHSNAVLSGLSIRFTANVYLTLTAGLLTNSCIRDKNGRYPVLSIGSAGVVTHCRIVNNTAISGLEKHSGVLMYGGALLNSEVSGNKAGSDSSGIYLVSGSPLVRNCLVVSNESSTWPGAGLYIGKNASAVIESCTVANNKSPAGSACGGIYSAATTAGELKHVIRNTVVYGNRGGTQQADAGGAWAGYTNAFFYSLAPELPAGEQGNLSRNPNFMNRAAGDFRLDICSPGLDAGTNQDWMAGAADLDKRLRATTFPGEGAGPVDLGCYETHVAATAALRIASGYYPESSRTSATVTFLPAAAGANTTVAWYGWDFDGDGAWDVHETGTPLPVSFEHAFGIGAYPWVFAVSNSLGEFACVTNKDSLVVHPLAYHLRKGGTAMAPYDTPEKAATNFDTLVSFVRGAVGDEAVSIEMGPGVFTNATATQITKAVHIRGEAGAVGTRLHLQGTRLELLHARATLDRLTLTGSGYSYGVLVVNAGLVTNCLIRNYSGYDSVVKNYGLITHSRIVSNSCNQGGAESSGCVLLGNGGLMQFCAIESNQSGKAGGAVQLAGTGILRNCLVAGNKANGTGGGGVYAVGAPNAFVESCTIVSNTCPANQTGAGIFSGTTALRCTNTIVSGNFLAGGLPSNVGGISNAYGYCLAPELAEGGGNVNTDPKLVRTAAGEWRLGADSPCRNAGTPSDWMGPWLLQAFDLWGRPRVAQGRVDIGAEELPPMAGTVVQIR